MISPQRVKVWPHLESFRIATNQTEKNDSWERLAMRCPYLPHTERIDSEGRGNLHAEPEPLHFGPREIETMMKTGSPQNQKSDKNVSCWMTEAEFNELGRECEEAVRGVPGARLSRSSFLVELFRQHLRAKGKPKQTVES